MFKRREQAVWIEWHAKIALIGSKVCCGRYQILFVEFKCISVITKKKQSLCFENMNQHSPICVVFSPTGHITTSVADLAQVQVAGV